MNNKVIYRYSNYYEYEIGSRTLSRQVDEVRLVKIIEACVKLLKKPYIRFMYSSSHAEACAVVYNDSDRVTKLVPISDIEKMIEEKQFHK